MFKIGEFSKLTQVSIRMLRYYDEQGLLKPAAIDGATNYRFYAAEQIPALGKIVFLRDLGFSVDEIAAALKDWSDGRIEEILEEKRSEIEAEIEVQQKRLLSIDLVKRDILQQKADMNYQVTIKSIPSYQALTLRRVVADYYQEGWLWKEMAAFVAESGIPVQESTFTLYHDIDYRETDVDIEICMPTEYEGVDRGDFRFRFIEPVPVMACMMVYGSFENIAGAFRAFAGWLEQHNQYEMGAGSRQIVHRGPWNEDDPEAYVTEMQIPLVENALSRS